MATVPGGIFDSSTTTVVGADQGALISTLLDSLGISEEFLSTVVEGSGGGTTLIDTAVVGNSTISTSALVVPDGGQAVIPLGDGASSPQILVGSGSGSGQSSGGIAAGGQFQKLASSSALTGGGPTIADSQAAFLNDAALKNNADPVTLDSIDKAISLLSQNGEGTPEELVVGYLRFALPAGTTEEVVVDTSNLPDDVLFAARLLDMTNGSTLVLKGLDKVILVGAGNARIDGSDAAMVVGDTTAQRITGGSGADTLVGGGGADTLTGGAGADEFGFIAQGHYTVTDFIKGTDMLAVDIDGITSLSQLQALQTGVTHAGGNTTFQFGENSSLTLVGVNIDSLTADMIKFTIG